LADELDAVVIVFATADDVDLTGDAIVVAAVAAAAVAVDVGGEDWGDELLVEI
jgi:hypothetical protein